VLVEGQPLIVPAGVQSNANNANTFQPYDPLEVPVPPREGRVSRMQ
jgi:hypothetical protein